MNVRNRPVFEKIGGLISADDGGGPLRQAAAERTLPVELFRGRASRRVYLLKHSVSFFPEPGDGSCVSMLLECGIIAKDFIDEQFCVIVARHQDFKLKGAGLILQAAGSMRPEQRQKPIPLYFHNVDCRNQREFGHDNRSSVHIASISRTHQDLR
jgi:hypothetical protein